MKWKSFENKLPTDGERILMLTTGCGVPVVEGFFIKRESVENYYNSGLISDSMKQQIKEHEIGIEIAITYGHPTSGDVYYIIIPIYMCYEEFFYTISQCINNNFKWIPFPEE